ncbi:hypothetical protein MTR67_052314 [Solanum verrucosum]|uniref:Cyclin N-terminal domain-containing protein n=1 Tax=Solanum verrucosum TaxID=315347 RepID=A0AAF0V7S1_SOLVR|nr:hypothetical protein MTR67_052314 [Solanum verrucosum]
MQFPKTSDAVVPKISDIPLTATCNMDIFPSHSDILVSMDESMDAVRSPEIEYIDDHESTVVDSIDKDKKRPSTYFMAKVQKYINPSMHIILIDWLVEVTKEYRLVPDTAFDN